jgi:hypothetical protein
VTLGHRPPMESNVVRGGYHSTKPGQGVPVRRDAASLRNHSHVRHYLAMRRPRTAPWRSPHLELCLWAGLGDGQKHLGVQGRQPYRRTIALHLCRQNMMMMQRGYRQKFHLSRSTLRSISSEYRTLCSARRSLMPWKRIRSAPLTRNRGLALS